MVGFEGFYEVSDLGRVRSIRNNHGNPRSRLMSPSVTHDGYQRVTLSNGTGLKTKKHVAHMVLEAFVGPRPEHMQCCHGPAGQRVNTLGNLRWDTSESNYQDRTDAGTLRGVNHHAATIDEETAKKIKRADAPRVRTARDIANEFGVSVNVVYNIRRGATWSWL